MKTKVLFILHLPPPIHGSSIMGGYIKNSNTINKTFNASYINLGTSKTIDEIGKNGFKKWIIYFKIVFNIIKHSLVFKPNLVYIAMTAKGIGFYKDLFAILIVKILRLPLVIHFHNKGVSANQHKAFDNFLYKIVFKNTKVILLSKHLFYDIEKYVTEDDVYYCPNGIVDLRDTQITSSLIKNETVQLLFLSNLIESKGVFVLLEALSILKKNAVKFQCNLVGGIGDISKSHIEERISQLNLENEVYYLGKKYNKDKVAIFRASDIFVHPSLNDCFPLVLLEASQFKLPMVSTFEGAIPEIIEDGVNGFLVTKNNSIALAEKLEILINDKNLRLSLGNAAFKKYEKQYRLSTFEDNMSSILKAINLN